MTSCILNNKEAPLKLQNICNGYMTIEFRVYVKKEFLFSSHLEALQLHSIQDMPVTILLVRVHRIWCAV